MDRLFTTAPMTEDQQYSRAILEIHVAHRAVNAFSALATVGVFARKLVSTQTTPLTTSLLRGNAAAVLLGIVGGAVMVEMKMADKQPIEWQDRSWRLLHNKTQNDIDMWSAGGAFAGFSVTRLTGNGFVRGLGGLGLGSVAGIAAFGLYKKADEMGLLAELKQKVNDAKK
ncbi:hypothetical protein HDU98_006602 [Podochytrium sp. JEL0797]|nr:hypothetical protein HDU98_006602 [Podochytrium sp. JEL0797]